MRTISFINYLSICLGKARGLFVIILPVRSKFRKKALVVGDTALLRIFQWENVPFLDVRSADMDYNRLSHSELYYLLQRTRENVRSILLLLFLLEMPLQSALTIAGLSDVGWGGKYWKWRSPGWNHPDRCASHCTRHCGAPHQPAAATNFREVIRSQTLTRWTMSIRPGLHKAFGMGQEFWRAQKEGSVVWGSILCVLD